jgi:hypothetical protein
VVGKGRVVARVTGDQGEMSRVTGEGKMRRGCGREGDVQCY